MGDPRVFFAAERTLLAWIRTAITLMALGFVVARFGLFLALLGAQQAGVAHTGTGHALSSGVGVVLILLSAAVLLLALYNHRHFIRLLPADDVPTQPAHWLPVALSLMMVACALMLAAYVALS